MTKKDITIEKAYDETNSENEPWLMNSHMEELYIDSNNNNELLTAEYIWSQQQDKRDELVTRVFKMLREKQFIDLIPKLSEEELKKKYESLKNSDINSILDNNDEVINSNSLCTDVLKHFCGELFYAASGDTSKSYSCKDVFENDEKLMKVLRNRMGYRVSKEDGKERPYIFSMSDKMILQGMRSSGLAYSVSTFKPMLAKFIVEHLNVVGDKVFDYSAGWGARALGVGALDKKYYGIDPLTYNNVNTMMKYCGIEGEVFPGGSENVETYNKLISLNLKNEFNVAFSSPPYFSLEKYSDQKEQSIALYPEYDRWLNCYWHNTVKNCIDIVLNKNNRTFVLVMLNKYKKYNLIDDMTVMCNKLGLTLDKIYNIRTSKSHLSGKIKTNENTKNTEKILIFK